ncbi:MAG: hypothetical protein ABI234_04865 [Ktedonobacteraceae bacterium]
MHNSLPSEAPSTSGSWSPSEVIADKPDRQDRLLGWWYALTATPELPASASFVKREAVRRVRLFSTVTFFFLLVILFFLPACPFLPNPNVTLLDAILVVATLITLWINRMGKPLLAGILLIIAAEIILTAVITTTLPFDETSIQLYDLYIIIDLLAVSLIPAQSVFFLAICNSLFIYLDILYQPKTPILVHDLITQFIPVVVRPVGLQIIVAGVAYIWVRSATRAIARADRAEMVAALEHTIAEERSSSDLAKTQMEESIQQLVLMHTEAMNGQMVAKLSYPQEAKMLWPLIGVINSLWVRLQRSHQTDYELRQLKQMITSYAGLLRQGALAPQQPVPIYRTKTDLDTLILEIGNLQRTLRERSF